MSLTGWNVSEIKSGAGPQVFTVPERRLGRVASVLCKLVTSSVNGIRKPGLQVFDPAFGIVGEFPSANQNKEDMNFHVFAFGMVDDITNMTLHLNTIPFVYLRENDGIRFLDLDDIDPVGDVLTLRVSANLSTF